eukprot:7386245-Prymnesium_polylepis.1
MQRRLLAAASRAVKGRANANGGIAGGASICGRGWLGHARGREAGDASRRAPRGRSTTTNRRSAATLVELAAPPIVPLAGI